MVFGYYGAFISQRKNKTHFEDIIVWMVSLKCRQKRVCDKVETGRPTDLLGTVAPTSH